MSDNNTGKPAKTAKTPAKTAKEKTTAFEAEAGKEKLPAQEIFKKISELQTAMNSAFSAMVQFKDAISAIVGENEERNAECYERITEICQVFKAREENFLKILEIYEKMYNDTQKR